MRKIIAFLLWSVLAAVFAGAQNTQLDPAFGNNGFTITDFGQGPEEVAGVVPLPSGKLLLGGTAWNGNPDFLLARFHADGSPDGSFGSRGRVFIDMEGADRLVFVQVLPDGKILLAGSSGVSEYGYSTGARFALARCLPDGSLDASFGDNGRVFATNSLTYNNYAVAAAVQPDGKILITGTITEPYVFDSDDIAVLRFTPDGAPDTTFGTGGIAVFDPGPGQNPVGGIALQAGGEIVLAATRDTLNGDILLIRLLPGGQPDTTFGDGGMVRSNLFVSGDDNFRSIDRAAAVAIKPDSTIVVVGHSARLPNNQHLAAVWYSPDGVLEHVALALPGIFGTPPPWQDAREEGAALAIQPDGKVVAVGNHYSKNADAVWEPSIFLVRFNTGQLDDAFNGSGVRIVDINDYDRGQAVALLPGGEILAAGHTYDGFDAYNDFDIPSDIALVRVDSAGALDTTLAHTGVAVVAAGTNTDRGTDVALQADGKILVGAVVDTIFPYTLPVKPSPEAAENNKPDNFIYQNLPNFSVARYLDDGTPDPSFGKNGRTGFTVNEPDQFLTNDYSYLFFPPLAPLKTAIAQRPNGNILVVGAREYDFGVAEFYPDGTQDSTFLLSAGSQLILPIVQRIDFSIGADVATAIVPDETFVFTPPFQGYTVAGYSGDKVAVAWCCYVPNLGNAFRKGVFDIGPSYEYATAVGYQPDTALNKINTLVGGFYLDGFGPWPRMFLMRLENEGLYSYTLDTIFGNSGILIPSVGNISDRLNAFSIQADNTIIAAGAVDGQMAVFKFLPDGAFDTSFGAGGFVLLPEGSVAEDLVVQSNGKIAVTGSTASGKIMTARLLSNGARDPAWGIDGVLLTGLRGKRDQGAAIARQDDGKIVVAGASDAPFAGADIAVLRYLPNSGVALFTVSATVQAVSCPDGSDGQLSVSASGGVPPYTFFWNTGDTTSALAGLAAGAYTVTATDSEGRQATLPVQVPEPPGLDAGILVETPVTCAGLPGVATCAPAGGTPPYDLQWSSGDSGPSAILPAGIFSVTLTDTHGCTAVFEGLMPEAPDTTAPTLTCPDAITTPACAGPVNFSLPLAADNCAIAGLSLVAGLPPGSVFPEGATLVRYQVTDQAGNTASCAFEVVVENTLALAVEAAPACAGELNTLSALASGGTPPYLYAWSNGATGAVINVPSGLYTVTLTDALGCSRTGMAFVQEFLPIDVAATITPAWVGTSNGAIQATAAGGEPPYGFAWYQNGLAVGMGPALTSIPAGVYTLVVTDAAGCTQESAWTVPEVVATGEPENVLQCRVSPNPFAQTVILQLELRRSADVRWAVTDPAGRLFEQQNAGHTAALQAEWNGGALAPGLYVLRVWIDGETLLRKLVKTGGQE